MPDTLQIADCFAEGSLAYVGANLVAMGSFHLRDRGRFARLLRAHGLLRGWSMRLARTGVALAELGTGLAATAALLLGWGSPTVVGCIVFVAGAVACAFLLYVRGLIARGVEGDCGCYFIDAARSDRPGYGPAGALLAAALVGVGAVSSGGGVEGFSGALALRRFVVLMLGTTAVILVQMLGRLWGASDATVVRVPPSRG